MEENEPLISSPTVHSKGSTVRSVASAYSRRNRPRTNPTSPNRFASAIGRVANPLIGAVDVDGIIQRIDFNEVVSKIDWNAVVDEIDWNNLLDQVDMDALIDKVDVNRAVERIDVNAVIERSNLKQIIARSTSGMCSIVLNRFRAICIKIDQIVQRTGRCAWCMCCCPKYQTWTLPPLPTVPPSRFHSKFSAEDREVRQSLGCPKASTKLATAVQGRNAGTFTRFLAYAIDKLLTMGFALLGILIVSNLLKLIPEETITSQVTDWVKQSDGNFTREDLQQAAATITPEEYLQMQAAADQAHEEDVEEKIIFGFALPIFVVNCIAFVVDALSMAAVGRTLGKAMMGLVVVNSRGGKVGHITLCQAICRSFITNFLVVFVWIGTCFNLAREDRRSLIDLLCSTTVIYAWDAKNFRMASDELAKERPYGDLNFESLNFDTDLEESVISQAVPSTPPRHSRVKNRTVSRQPESDISSDWNA